MEDNGRSVRQHAEQVRRSGPRRGKLDGLVPSSTRVAYSVSSAQKLLNIGVYMGMQEGSQDVDIHAFGVAKDYRMNAKWRPLYEGAGGKPVFAGEDGNSGRPVIDKVPIKNIIRPVNLTQKRSPRSPG